MNQRVLYKMLRHDKSSFLRPPADLDVRHSLAESLHSPFTVSQRSLWPVYLQVGKGIQKNFRLLIQQMFEPFKKSSLA